MGGPAIDVGAGAGGGTVTNINIGTGLTPTAGSITVTGTIAVDTGTFGDAIATKIPFFNASNQLEVRNPGRLYFTDANPATQEFTVFNDGTYRVHDLTNTVDALTIAPGGVVSAPVGLTVTGLNVCLSDGTNCLAGSVSSVGTGVATVTGLLGGPITSTGTLSVNLGTGPNQVPQLDGSGQLNTSTIPIVPVNRGGTGSATAAGARTNLGLGTAAVTNTGTTNGTIPLIGVGDVLDTSIIPVVPVAQGGTGATTAAGARTNLDVIKGAAIGNVLEIIDVGGATPGLPPLTAQT